MAAGDPWSGDLRRRFCRRGGRGQGSEIGFAPLNFAYFPHIVTLSCAALILSESQGMAAPMIGERVAVEAAQKL
ncbi:hypothetical protein, partial [Sphingobium yanoikuyae]|uniref:hypothetical protein n=1 Tax=Sphingobium yanoikuyae TaxID=13690 RepID=UPI00241C974F